MDSQLQVFSVNSKQDMMSFIKSPQLIYYGDKNWVSPLIDHQKKFFDKDINPFFRDNTTKFFLAYRNGDIVGRVAAIINFQHNKTYNDKIGFFGFLESINDINVFNELLTIAEHWLLNHGCNKIVGPVYPSIHDQVGFLVEGYDSPPYIMLSHNPIYYTQYIELSGYKKIKDFYSYIIHKSDFQTNNKITKIKEHILKKHKINLREIKFNNINTELEIIRQIYNDSMSKNWKFTPIGKEEFIYKANDLMQIMDPKLALIVEYNNKPVGIVIAIPNFNEVLTRIRNGKLFPFGFLKILLYRNRIKSVRIMILGIMQKFQKLGLDSLFYSEITNRIFDRGYEKFEMSWIVEDNLLMNRTAFMLGGSIHKKYRVYQKSLFN